MTFPSGSETGAMQCVNITIVDNVAFEKDEEFSVSVTAAEEGVAINSSLATATVTILDNEG